MSSLLYLKLLVQTLINKVDIPKVTPLPTKDVHMYMRCELHTYWSLILGVNNLVPRHRNVAESTVSTSMKCTCNYMKTPRQGGYSAAYQVQ